MKEKFLSEYAVIKMVQNSLVCQNRNSGKTVYIHRDAFNSLDEAMDYEETEVTFANGKSSTWIEVLVWKTFGR